MKQLSSKLAAWAVALAIGGALVVAQPVFAHGDGHGSNCPPSNPVDNQTTHTCYPTIQSAVDAASPGDTLIAGPGTYHENVTIPTGKDGLTLESRVGPHATTIIGHLSGSSSQSVVEIDADSVTLGGSDKNVGFTIRNETNPAAGGYDLHLVGIGFDSGVTNGVTVQGNILNDLVSGPLPATSFGRVDGVAGSNTTNARILGNTIGPWNVTLNSGDAKVFTYGVLFFASNTTPTIAGNDISNIAMTGGVTGSSFAEPEGVLGVAINDQTAGAEVASNEVSQLSSSGKAIGISVSETVAGTTVNVVGNSVDRVSSSTGSSAGVLINPGNPTTSVAVESASLSQNGIGILVSGSPAGSHAHNTNLSDNPVGVYNATATPFDATSDWWGCPTGPNTAHCDSTMGGPVNYTPWLRKPAKV